MRIPDGDLVPRRRRSRYGGGYGRRRRRGPGFAVGGVLLLAVTSAGYWFGVRDEQPRAAVVSCPTPTASATTPALVLPAPAHVRLALLNGTARNGLAKTVGDQLKQRGFVVASEGNASAALGGPSTVTYGPGALGPATVLARHVVGARLVSDPRAPAGRLVLVLGGDYRRLATPAEVTAAASPPAGQAVVPAPTRSPC